MNKQGLTVGCDPEVFLIKDGEPFPSTGIVGGTKNKPRKLSCGAVLEDNIMAEIHIKPAETSKKFSRDILQMLRALKDLVATDNCQILIEPYAKFKDQYLISAAAQEMGCEADYDAYSLARNPPYHSTSFGNFRFAGGHIHIGFNGANENPNIRSTLVKWLDLLVALPMLAKNGLTERGLSYGSPGRFRPKPYGIEYRTPDNTWLQTEERMRWIFRRVVKAVENATSLSVMPLGAQQVRDMLNNRNHLAQPTAVKYCEYADVPKFPDA